MNKASLTIFLLPNPYSLNRLKLLWRWVWYRAAGVLFNGLMAANMKTALPNFKFHCQRGFHLVQWIRINNGSGNSVPAEWEMRK